MTAPRQRNGWGYYAAVVVFLAVTAFAVLGLVRSSTVVRPQAATLDPSPTPGSGIAANRPAPTARIPPPTPSAPTEPPSRTWIHPPPEAGITPSPGAGAQPRR